MANIAAFSWQPGAASVQGLRKIQAMLLSYPVLPSLAQALVVQLSEQLGFFELQPCYVS